MRRPTRNFFLGKVGVGSNHPVSIQSMCNTRTADIESTLKQIDEIAGCGGDIIRVSADNPVDCRALKTICQNSPLPVIADIQFSPESALEAIAAGCAGIRVNPGIINDEKIISRIAACAVANGTVIRVGANAGSLKVHEIRTLQDSGMNFQEATAQALCNAVQKQCAILEKYGVKNIKTALKCSDLSVTLAAYRKFAASNDYPMHLGLTEAGLPERGEIKSAICIGALLTEGIGDTIRVSLTADPVREIIAAKRILECCGLRGNRVEIIACPTCGRTEIDLIGLTGKVEGLLDKLQQEGKKLRWQKIAVMGCPVNGPGEARNADIGIAGSRNGQLIIFRKGEVAGAYPEDQAFAEFAKLIVS